MRAVIQRVAHASVVVENQTVGEIANGFLILLGVRKGDNEHHAKILAEKTARLRVFQDEAGKMNRSLLDTGGEALVVSQFTICADCKKGNRPSFDTAAPPDEAKALYALFQAELRRLGIKKVESGIFGADMKVELLNDGPVTILLDTDRWENARKEV